MRLRCCDRCGEGGTLAGNHSGGSLQFDEKQPSPIFFSHRQGTEGQAACVEMSSEAARRCKISATHEGSHAGGGQRTQAKGQQLRRPQVKRPTRNGPVQPVAGRTFNRRPANRERSGRMIRENGGTHVAAKWPVAQLTPPACIARH